MFPHLQPEYVSNAEVNNKQNDYDVFYFTFKASARQGGSVNQPVFSLGLAGLLGDINIYNQNHIYIIPTFFSGHIQTSLLTCGQSDYYEVRADAFQAHNENNKTGDPFVLLRGQGEAETIGVDYTHYEYNTYNRENNKGLRLPSGILNFDNITFSVNEIDGSVVNFNGNTQTYNRNFVLQFKIVCYKK